MISKKEIGKIEGIALCLTTAVGIADSNGALSLVEGVIPDLISLEELKKYAPMDFDILSSRDYINEYFEKLEKN